MAPYDTRSRSGHHVSCRDKWLFCGMLLAMPGPFPVRITGTPFVMG